MRQIVLIVHNVRSSHNVGSLLRTADGLGVQNVYLTGYTPYPMQAADKRLPHVAAKIERQITKTALGAEKSVAWQHAPQVEPIIRKLIKQGYEIVALEQSPLAQRLPDFKPTQKVAIIVGREVEGLEPEVLATAQKIIEIPMFGQKESFNVVQAAAMALYHCRFTP